MSIPIKDRPEDLDDLLSYTLYVATLFMFLNFLSNESLNKILMLSQVP